ncbi:DNA-binding transcriptional activator PunR [Paraferrimonas haliotis]|uniref:LysR family transcriptional regulator n=1 Tax=Paraferrimonas haliotis TaxID=2013866 RepID=A0AA37TNH3_9GAMM|nr:DNA-binding transcriptional activator PunR [Paraferrimonas haliotis]GLS82913.1 LysR family transcriptional regulator [Paraferrimonas haliotis]
MFSYQDLSLIVCVAKHGSFSRAAKELHKVPSAISYSVKTIEQDVGTNLFKRLPRRVEPTSAGLYFIEQAQHLLEQMDDTRIQCQRLANGWTQSVSLALDNVVKQAPVNQLVRDFYQAFPDVELSISMEVFNGVWDALQDGRADIAIGATAAIPVEGQFINRPMGALNWRFVMSPSHPLASLHDPLDNEQLAHYPSICLEDTSRNIVKRTTWLLDNQRRLVVPNWHAASECLIDGLGIGVMPEHMAVPLIDKGLLVSRTLAQPMPSSPCCLAWRREQSSPALEWIISYLGDSEQLRRHWLEL